MLFAYEFHWRPVDVWALKFAEFCTFADFVDNQLAERRKASKRR